MAGLRPTIASGVTLVAFVLLAFPPPALAQERAATVRRVREPIRNRYIVVLANSDDSLAVGSESAAVYRGRLRHVFRQSVNGFSIEMSATSAAALARDPRVRYVEEDGVVRATSVQSSPPWGLDRIDQRTLPLSGSYAYPDPTSNVYVHVIDTGIRASHVEFGGRAVVAGDFVDDDHDNDPVDVGNDDPDPFTLDGADCSGHGTHVAGTIGGSTYGVAKTALLFAYRVLDCTGVGSTSGVIAAIDAVAGDPRRPAVANLSLGGPPSDALDDAVRDAIAMGITVTIAAGNDNVNAAAQSPGRVSEAITVGATSITDVRASFSNFGSLLDLFAPGVSIQSSWFTSDMASVTISGTSMAAPHVAGVAALYLQGVGNRTPAQVRDAIVAGATVGAVVNPGVGSPNLLLYSLIAHTIPAVTVLQPNGGERLFSGTPYPITWDAADPDGLAAFDILVSVNNGVSYSPIPGCTNLHGSVRQCVWSAPGPATSNARIKVAARDNFGDAGADVSDAKLSLLSGVAALTVTAPNTALTLARGSTQTIKWSHNLGANAYVRIELSRDGGGTFSETIAESVKNSSSSSGSFVWHVPGPATTGGVVRVTWTAAGVSDVSNVPFTIVEPTVTVSAPAAGINWGYSSLRRVTWQTNLGVSDRVDVLLSTDGGATFPIVLASNIAASAEKADVLAPALATATSQARVRVVWTNPPAGVNAAGISPVFTVAPSFVTVTAPNGGESWTVGSSRIVRWTSNLGSFETVLVELSLDGGATFPIVVLPSTPTSDGKETIVINPAWTTPTARMRITWLKNAAVTDTSNASFSVP